MLLHMSIRRAAVARIRTSGKRLETRVRAVINQSALASASTSRDSLRPKFGAVTTAPVPVVRGRIRGNTNRRQNHSLASALINVVPPYPRTSPQRQIERPLYHKVMQRRKLSRFLRGLVLIRLFKRRRPEPTVCEVGRLERAARQDALVLTERNDKPVYDGITLKDDNNILVRFVGRPIAIRRLRVRR